MSGRTLKEPVTVAAEYKTRGCHVIHGEVVISAAPADSFSFASEAVWPAESLERVVRKGVLDALEEAGLGSDFGAAFTLREVGWREADSCEAGFHRAAKQAAAEILKTAVPAPDDV